MNVLTFLGSVLLSLEHRGAQEIKTELTENQLFLMVRRIRDRRGGGCFGELVINNVLHLPDSI